MPIFRVLKTEEKYDSMSNVRSDGLYRNYLYEIKPKDEENYESIWVSHSEYFDHWTNSWRACGQHKNFEIEKPNDLDKYKIVNDTECHESCPWEFWKILERKTEKLEFDRKT